MILLRIYLGQYLNLLENDQSLCGGEISALILLISNFKFTFLIYYLKLTAKLLFVSKKILFHILLK